MQREELNLSQNSQKINNESNVNDTHNQEIQIQSNSDDQVNDVKQHKQYYIKDPHQYLQLCLKDKKIKVMDERNPILEHVYLKDISLHKKGPLEDKIYSRNNLYYCNIRRGNTLCQIYDQKQNEKQLFMCRRGMKKFYDLEPEYLKVNRKLTHQHSRFRNRIFQKLDSAIGNHKIHLYAIFKENGEHCQISYIKCLGYWLFASKNVAILAKNQQDLDNFYHKQRFYWAKLIGKQFFKIIKNFSQEQIKSFIQDIEGKTLLGEHCGYQDHQHITKYQKVQIIFYGLIENNGNEHCLPVKQCQSFLKKFGLKMSKMQKIENLSEKNQIYAQMYKMLKKIAQGTMNQCGQGSVMYIVAQNQQKQQMTVGMCKLKTCEYLIFRKLRQMIKINFAKKGATANGYNKYIFQIQNLCQTYFKPPQPLDYYFSIAKQAFKQIQAKNQDFADSQLRYKFVSFLQKIEQKANIKKQGMIKSQTIQKIKRIILICLPLLKQQASMIQKFCKNNDISIQYTYRQQANQKLNKSIMHIVHMVPRLNLQELQNNSLVIVYRMQQKKIKNIIEELQQNADIKKSHLITFIKSSNKAKSIQLLNDKINLFATSCQDLQVKNKNTKTAIATDAVQIIELIEHHQQEMGLMKSQKQLLQSNKPKINVIITMLIPGSGKSSLVDTIISQFSQYPIKVISSDKIRQGVMQKFKSKRKDQIQTQQIYAATKKKGLQKYLQAVHEAIGQSPPQQHQVIIIDRVFCPNTTLQNIMQIYKPWTYFTIITQTQINTKLNEYIYPHSLNYLLGCVKRSLQRQQHETLTSKPEFIVRVVLKFFQMYRGFNYKKLEKQLNESNIQSSFLQLQFVKENQQVQNLFLKKKVEECLKLFSPGFDAPESNLYTDLIQLIYKYSDHIQRKKQQQDQKQSQLRKNAQKLVKFCRV